MWLKDSVRAGLYRMLHPSCGAVQKGGHQDALTKGGFALEVGILSLICLNGES